MAKSMTLDDIKREPGKALGQIDRQAGKIKRLEVKLAASEKLAETRLHGRGIGFGGRSSVPPRPAAPKGSGAV